MSRRTNTPTRLLFIRTDRLGETVLNLPVLHALREAWPACRLTFVAHPSVQPLLAGHPDIDEAISEPSFAGPWWRRAWALGQWWRSFAPDILVISNPRKEYHLAAGLSGIPRRIGYDRKWPWGLTDRISDEKSLGGLHEVQYNMRLLTPLGLSSHSAPVLRLPVTRDAEQRLTQLLARHGIGQDRLVAVHPWTSNPAKRWPMERYRLLLQRIPKAFDARVLVIGAPEEAADATEWLAGVKEPVVNLVGSLSLPELAACLHRVNVLVTNDSGPMHVAAAVGTPVVAVFGTADAGSHPRRWGPWGGGHAVIHQPLEQTTIDDILASIQRTLPSWSPSAS